MTKRRGQDLTLGMTVAIALLSQATIASAQSAPAPSIADTFRGKNLRLLIPSSPGGDRVTYSLAFAGHYSKHIPGNPNIVPVFMPGAGGSNALNNAYNVAAPDGLTLVTPLTAVVMAQAVGDMSVRYDVSKFKWIGRTADATRVFIVRSQIPARTLADFKTRETLIGAVGRASETYLNPAFVNQVFGTKFKIVSGYSSAGQMNLSLDTGETEGTFTTWNDVSTHRADWLRDGKIRIVLQIAFSKHPDLANVPLLLDLAENADDRELIEFMSSPSQMGQAFAAPPGTPEPIVSALRRAFDDTMRDPAFIKQMHTAKMQFNPIDGEALTRIVQRTIGAPKHIIDRYKAAVSGP
jgi:tripartite-type tricarboxylate transporter receptor subunit TctC